MKSAVASQGGMAKVKAGRARAEGSVALGTAMPGCKVFKAFVLVMGLAKILNAQQLRVIPESVMIGESFAVELNNTTASLDRVLVTISQKLSNNLPKTVQLQRNDSFSYRATVTTVSRVELQPLSSDSVAVLPGEPLEIFFEPNSSCTLSALVHIYDIPRFIVPNQILLGSMLQVRLLDANIPQQQSVNVTLKICALELCNNITNIALYSQLPGTFVTTIQTNSAMMLPTISAYNGQYELSIPCQDFKAAELYEMRLMYTPLAINVTSLPRASVRIFCMPSVAIDPPALPLLKGVQISVKVIDTNARNSRNVSIFVSSRKHPGNNITLALTDGGLGEFTGTLNSTLQFSQLLKNDVLGIEAEDLITFSYTSEASNVQQVSYVPVLSNATLKLQKATSESPFGPFFASSTSTFYGILEIRDSDRNSNPLAVENISTSIHHETMTSDLVLFETAESSGLFTTTLAHDITGSTNLTISYSDVQQDGQTRNLTLFPSKDLEARIVMEPNQNILPQVPIVISVVDNDIYEELDISQGVWSQIPHFGPTIWIQQGAKSFGETLEPASNSIFDTSLNISALSNSWSEDYISFSYIDYSPPSLCQKLLRIYTSGSLSLPSTNVLHNRSISISVVDPDANHDPFYQDEVFVELRFESLLLSTLSLSETGLDVGHFTANLDLDSAYLTLMQQNLSLSGAGMKFLLSYPDMTPGGSRYVNASLEFGHQGSLSTSVSKLGVGVSDLLIAVADADLNQDPTVAESYIDILNVSFMDGAVTVNMTEEGIDSSTFSARVSVGQQGSGDAVLQFPSLSGVESYLFTLEYFDRTAGAAAVRKVIDTERTGIVNVVQTGSDSGKCEIGKSISISVLDKDLDVSDAVDSCTVLIHVSSPDFDQNVTLTETAATSGVFTASILTVDATTASSGSAYRVVQGATVSFTYLDQNPHRLISSSCILGYPGRLSVAPSTLLYTVPNITLLVQDPSPVVLASLQITYKLDSGPVNTPTLYVANTSLSLYGASVVFAQANLVPKPGSRLVVTYTNPSGIPRRQIVKEFVFGSDCSTSSGSCPQIMPSFLFDRNPYCAESLQYSGSCGPSFSCGLPAICGTFQTGSNGLTSSSLPAGSSLVIIVNDTDRNLDSQTIDTVNVTVQSAESSLSIPMLDNAPNPYCSNVSLCSSVVVRRGREQEEEIALFETAPSSGVFTGILLTQDSPMVDRDRNGIIHVLAGDILNVTYMDLPTSSDSLGKLRASTISVVQAGSISKILTAKSAKPGTNLTIELLDLDLVSMASVVLRLLVLDMQGAMKYDNETVVLYNSGSNTGRFVGSLKLIPEASRQLKDFCANVNVLMIPGDPSDVYFCSASTQADGQLAVTTGDEIFVEYIDTSPMTSIAMEVVKVVESFRAVLHVDLLFPFEEQDVEVTVEDQDLNLNGMLADVALVRLESNLFSDPISLRLVETGSSTGVFTGVIGYGQVASHISHPLNDKLVNVTYMDVSPSNTVLVKTVQYFPRVRIIFQHVQFAGRMSVQVCDQQYLRLQQNGRNLSQPFASLKYLNWTEQILLTEDGGTPPCLTFSFDLYQAQGAARNLAVGVNVTVDYNSSLQPNIVFSNSTSVGASTQSFFFLSPPSPRIGDQISIRLFNVDSAEGSIPVSISSPLANCSILLKKQLQERQFFSGMLILRETGQASCVSTSASTIELLVRAGQNFTVRYQDMAPYQSVSYVQTVLRGLEPSFSASPRGYKEKLRMEGVLDVFVEYFSQPAVLVNDSLWIQLSLLRKNSQILTSNISISRNCSHSCLTFSGEIRIIDELKDCATRVAPDSHVIPARSGDELQLVHSTGYDSLFLSLFIYPSTLGQIVLAGSSDCFSYQSEEICAFEVGSTLSISVLDPDLNEDASLAETSSVIVSAAPDGNLYKVVITETSDDSPTFTGAFQTVASASVANATKVPSNENLVVVTPGYVIAAYYQDNSPIYSIRSQLLFRAKIQGRFLLYTNFLKAGEKMQIILADRDLDRRSSVSENATVIVTSPSTQDMENVTLLETGPSTGVFSGLLQTFESNARGSRQSGFLDVIPSSQVELIYPDDSGTVVQVILSVRESLPGLLLAAAVSDWLQPIEVTVFDSDGDVSPAVDTVKVQVANLTHSSPGQSFLVLYESGNTTGIFTSTVIPRSSEELNSGLHSCSDVGSVVLCKQDSDCLGSNCSDLIIGNK
eukprot:746090-Hanusia_phi.AAC.6